MKLTMPAELLRQELATVVPIVPKTTTQPNLEYVLVEPKAKNIRFSATDGVAQIDSFLKIDKTIKIEDGRAVCLPARKLYELVKLMPTGDVTLEILPTSHVNVKYGKSKYRLGSIDASRYPAMKDEWNEPCIVPGGSLRRMIKLTRGFIGENDSRFAFSGGLLEFQGEVMRLVVTDGARLAIAEIPHDNQEQDICGLSVLIPHRSLVALSNLIKGDADLNLAVARDIVGAVKKVRFKLGSTFFTTNLTTGAFPAWRMCVPETELVKVELNREEFMNALKKSLVVSDTKNRILELNFTDDGVLVKTDGDNAGSDVVAAEYVIGEPSEDRVGVNADYLNQFLSVVPEVLDDDTIVFTYTGPTTFFNVSPAKAEFDFKYLLAPARI